ncbi:hypothetical protein C900_01478 [Fulvivirga imtechensis AK7]|uniref:Lipoprotein n=1 Tax=Fulvivirga imtechensis AK7 TaxID=1237149 RepID=L8JWA3_9BACT|nr:hypothetical protein [Fulvivirga imtechensis]ELR72483.1 hypothetical protein C900_01478 [Fulvivirga imtechensis AK7]
MTKLFHNKPTTWFCIVLFSALIVASSCSTEEEVSPEPEYSGEEIFRGLFFWQGPLAGKMEVLKPGAEQLATNMTKDQWAEYAQFSDEIVRQVNVIDPGYLAEFKRSMQSENLYEIELALQNAQSMFEAAGKRSSYAEHFELLTEIKDKNVDVNSEKFRNLDLTNAKDAEAFAKIFKEDYGIELPGTNTVSGRGHCLAVFVVAVVAGNVVYVVNVAAAWNVAMAANFTKVQNYQIPRFESNDATAKSLISELAAVIN